ncbi:MAG: helix-turn-helix domain-containing protein [Ignavibacteria bacterium]|nr:helix-turn-helix domain-containing protein [Ignavibacteria bacterium]
MSKQHLRLSETDRKELLAMSKQNTLSVKIYKRVLYLLALDSGRTFQSITKEYSITPPVLRRLIDKYNQFGILGVNDKARSGRPVVISGTQRVQITALACSQAPAGYARWSLRLLSEKIVELEICEHISHEHVSKILKKTICNPILNEHGAFQK